MTLDALQDGEICPYCGTPVFFHGEGVVDCPGCGAEFVNAEDDRADELRDDATSSSTTTPTCSTTSTTGLPTPTTLSSAAR